MKGRTVSFLRAMKTLLHMFLSLKTVFALFLACMAILFVGSLSLTSNLAFFSGIDETPLFVWLSNTGKIGTIWWIYTLILLLVFLAVSTLLCTGEALIARFTMQRLFLKLSPQIMHIGVLFIMLGHLLTASMGFKSDVLIKKGETRAVTDGTGISLKEVTVWKDRNGYDTDWEAIFTWSQIGGEPREAAIRPARPSYFGDFGFYSKAVVISPEAAALIRVCRDPGAKWGLFGGMLLSLGGIGFLFGRFAEDH